MKFTDGAAEGLLPDYEDLPGPQVGRQVGVVLFQVGDGGVVGLRDTAEGLAFLDFVVGGGGFRVGRSLGTALGRFALLA